MCVWLCIYKHIYRPVITNYYPLTKRREEEIKIRCFDKTMPLLHEETSAVSSSGSTLFKGMYMFQRGLKQSSQVTPRHFILNVHKPSQGNI